MHHFVKEKIDVGSIQIAFGWSMAQTANIFTKGLTGPLFQQNVSKLNKINMHAQLARSVKYTSILYVLDLSHC